MPANQTDTASFLEGTLKASLKGGSESSTSLNQHLSATAKSVLLEKIDFTPAERSSSYHIQDLRTKYTPLNPSRSPDEGSNVQINNICNKGRQKFVYILIYQN